MPAEQPNLLFVFSDEQSALALGASGNPWLQTPAQDGLAARGIRFNRSYCAAPVCGPSRACMVTGQPAHRTGVRYNGNALHAGLQTLGERLRDAGYDTAWAGKWHLPKSYPTGATDIAGFENLALRPEHPALFRDIGFGWPGHALGFNTDEPFVDRAIGFLERQHDRPFCLAVSLHNPHDICWWIRKPRRLPGPGALPPLPANFRPPRDEPDFLRQCRLRDHYGEEIRYTQEWTDDDWRLYLHAYYRMTEAVDAQLGRLLDALDQRKLSESTVVIYTSDHGEGMAAHQWVAKLCFQEEVVRVPLIMAGPGIDQAGRVENSSLVSGLDLAPTLCDFAGRSTPDLPGQSLRPLCRDPGAALERDHLVLPLDPDDHRPDMTGRAVITQRFKYATYSTGAADDTLHDLVADPLEQENLASHKDYAHILQEHRSLLRAWSAKSGDRMDWFPG